jgi:hypothetical protein
MDRLFYHVRLHSYFFIDLKIGAFRPEYAGKLSLYQSAVDGILRTERDDPTIGLLPCESRKGAVVEHAFKDIQKPIGVPTYRVTRELPEPLKAEVPSIETRGTAAEGRGIVSGQGTEVRTFARQRVFFCHCGQSTLYAAGEVPAVLLAGQAE